MGTVPHSGIGLGIIENSRTPEQLKYMQDTVGQGKCGFCDIDRSINPVDHILGEHWRAWENAWPYPKHMYHLVIPAIRHLTTLQDITNESALEAFMIFNFLIKKLKIPGGAIVLRFGDFKHHAGTLAHLHFQLQAPNLLGPAFITLSRPNESQVEEAVAILQSKPVEQGGMLVSLCTDQKWDIFDIHTTPTMHISKQYWLLPKKDLCSLQDLISDYPGMINELFALLKQLECDQKLPGGALVLRFGHKFYRHDGSSTISAKVIVADGTGPVLEVLHRAINRDQALCAMKTLVKPF